MATGDDLRRLALSLDGVVEAPHFDRVAFKAARTFATLAADGMTANIGFKPDEQDFNCLLAPEAFRKLPNAWGERGWTVATLSNLNTEELAKALETAWRHALPKRTAPVRRRSRR